MTRQGRINVTLTPAAQKFVLHWGEMGQAWGINRTMAQVHALLFVAPSPLDAEEISTLLDVSRSNVSTSLRELITWGVVRRVHIIGDRRDRFEALKDVMETFRVIMAERKRREMDPTIALLEHCVDEAKLADPTSNTPATSWKKCSSSPGWSRPGMAISTTCRPHPFCGFSVADRCWRRSSAEAHVPNRRFRTITKKPKLAPARSLDRGGAITGWPRI